MQILKKILFSTTTMGILLLIFLSSIGIATFIENDDSTEAAKILVYNALWFEVLLGLLVLNLIYNTFHYRLWRVQKIATLTFHLSFIVIIAGAAISRYAGEEGIIKVGQNEMVDFMYSAEPYLNIVAINEDGSHTSVEMQKWFAVSTPSDNQFSIDFPLKSGKKLSFEYAAFVPNAIDTVERVSSGGMEIIELQHLGKSHFLASGGIVMLAPDFYVSFNNPSQTSAIQITSEMGDLFVRAPYDGLATDMGKLSVEDRTSGKAVPADTLVRDTQHSFKGRTLYTFAGQMMVLKNYHDGVQMKLKSSAEEDVGVDALVVNAITENETRQLVLRGGKSNTGSRIPFNIYGQQFLASYGSKQVELPFQVGLKEFRLINYPGSAAPSSYESDVILTDTVNGVSREQTILMNHVMDYGEYRMFQSSYESSVKGAAPDITVLSVNKDFWGTWVTYIGYLFMALGFVFTLFFKTSRFRELSRLIKKTRKKAVMTIVVLSFGSGLMAQSKDYIPIAPELSEVAGKICVQDKEGRIKPLHTHATETLRKLYKADKYEDQDPVQVFLGMTFRPDHWYKKPIIKLRNDDIKKVIGISGDYASFHDFYDSGELNATIFEDYQNAFSTAESGRNAYQKELIKTVDKLQFMDGIFYRSELRVFPIPGHENNYWSYGYEPEYQEVKILPPASDRLDSLNLKLTMKLLDTVMVSFVSRQGDFTKAVDLFTQIGAYQRATANDLMPSESKINMEISYNRQHVLDKLYRYYFLIGLLVLIIELIFIISNVRKEQAHKWFRRIASILIGGLALWHAYALGARWYISGHAPWSNGYEALVFIGFMSVLAGLIFSKGSRLTIGASALLGGILLMTAHHSNYDPDISNLVPVLKSYWLMIHVAVITGSYGFLGLGAVLGFISLFLHIFRGKRNFQRVTLNIDEITYISEMTITIGLIMAAVGTFLGGVWANESWGRYWGWDAKETWALVIVLWYAILLHLRFIPGMKSKFLFNVVSMWSYWTVLMTFFGVNYYLSGLHSYAKGDAPPFPMWATVTIIILVVFTIVAIIRYRQSEKIQTK